MSIHDSFTVYIFGAYGFVLMVYVILWGMSVRGKDEY